jgi:heme/copper-type cytochrome/quinol oxidase subunit 1
MESILTEAQIAAQSAKEAPKLNYLTNGHSVSSWLLTRDHKRIAILYLISISVFFMVGGLFAATIRLELLTPHSDLLDPATYNRVFTAHGIIMIFLFLIPSIPATLGNFLIPIMVGAKDLAFPRINLLSWYLYLIGAAFALYALMQGGVDTGWTFYAPYSTTFSNGYVIATGMGAFVVGFSSILTGLNFIVTIHTMRAPGMTWFKMPLFVWAHYATSLMMLLGTPVIAITLLLMMLERFAHIGIFDPAIGGDPILFQHLFWFYSHPAVYIMILPGMGVISELISSFSRKRIFGYVFVAFSSIAIAVIGFLVYFIVAHFHYVMVGGQVIAYLGGVHYWWPKMTGKMYSEFWGKISAMLVFIGFNLTFGPQFVLGYLGMPRRYAAYPEELQVLNIFSSAGAAVLGLGMLLPAIYLTASLFSKKNAGANPWFLPGLEWRIPSPPPTENFETTPVVTWEAYDFGKDNGLEIKEAEEFFS